MSGASSSAAPGARRPRRRPGENRAGLIAAGTIEFGLHGYAGAQTSAIAARAGVSQPNVYANFSSKRDLFLACMSDLVGALAAPGAAPEGTAESPAPVPAGGAAEGPAEDPAGAGAAAPAESPATEAAPYVVAVDRPPAEPLRADVALPGAPREHAQTASHEFSVDSWGSRPREFSDAQLLFFYQAVAAAREPQLGPELALLLSQLVGSMGSDVLADTLRLGALRLLEAE